MTDFSSIDKLVEFGIGISLAQQMMNTMNYCIGNTAVPGVGINPSVKTTSPIEPKALAYFAVICDSQVGPLDDSQLRRLINDEKITQTSLVWRDGLNGWMLAKDIPDVNRWFYLMDKPQNPQCNG